MVLTFKKPPAEFTAQIKDGHGRILKATARQDPDNSQRYDCEAVLPSGETEKRSELFRESEVLPALGNWLNSKVRQFERDHERGDQRTRPTPVFAGMPPTDSPNVGSVGPELRYTGKNCYTGEDV